MERETTAVVASRNDQLSCIGRVACSIEAADAVRLSPGVLRDGTDREEARRGSGVTN